MLNSPNPSMTPGRSNCRGSKPTPWSATTICTWSWSRRDNRTRADSAWACLTTLNSSSRTDWYSRTAISLAAEAASASTFKWTRRPWRLLHLAGQPLQPGREPRIVEHRRTQLGGQRPRLGDGLIDEFGGLVKRFLEHLVTDASLEPAQAELAGHQELLEMVVQQLGQAVPLALLGLR